MAKKLILVNTRADILKYDNRKAIELAQTLGRPLTSKEYESLKIKYIPDQTAIQVDTPGECSMKKGSREQ